MPDAAPRAAEPPVGLGFKRNFVLPGVVLTGLELALIVWPLLQLFQISADQRAILLRAATPILVGAALIWLLAMGSWLAPVQRAITLRRRGEPYDAATAAAAYRALPLVPLGALWLRTGLWIAVGVASGVLLHLYSDWQRGPIVTLASTMGLYAFVVNIARAAWTARLLGRLRRQLFPSIEPLKQFSDGYFPQLLLVALLVGAAAITALAAFIYYFLPITAEEYLQIQTWLPGTVAALTVGWTLYSRPVKRPIH